MKNKSKKKKEKIEDLNLGGFGGLPPDAYYFPPLFDAVVLRGDVVNL